MKRINGWTHEQLIYDLFIQLTMCTVIPMKLFVDNLLDQMSVVMLTLLALCRDLMILSFTSSAILLMSLRSFFLLGALAYKI